MKAIFILLIGFVLSSSQIIKTQLHLTIRNDLGNTVEGASVTLYANANDYKQEQNPVQKGTTDAKGVVKFKELKAQDYFVLASKGDKDNTGAGEKTGALEANRINKVTLIIE